ncbi:MAG: acyltransferase [Cyanobacteria bacterium SZAS-4]|nr:acyltransferase [Cyanobacteria bacterium SZAS-4]
MTTTSVLAPKKQGQHAPRMLTLDCVRAIACMCVVLAHTFGGTIPWDIGSYGVSLFCVLSGFLITSLIIAEERSSFNFDVISFLQRRAVRILPMYFMVLGVCIALVKFGLILRNHEEQRRQILLEFPYWATLTHNFTSNHFLAHLWSISIEEQFYCVMPVIFICFRSCAIRMTILACLAAFMSFSQNRNIAFLAIISGSYLALFISTLSPLKPKIPTASLVLFSAALLAVSMQFRLSPYGPVAVVSFVTLIWLATSRAKNWSALKPIAYVGKISYGLYLVHLPLGLVSLHILTKFGLQDNQWCLFALTTILSIAIAATFWELIEKQIIHWGRVYLRKDYIGIAVAFISPTLVIVGALLFIANCIRTGENPFASFL